MAPIKMLLLAPALVFLFACGLTVPADQPNAPPREQGLGARPLAGSFRSVDGRRVALEDGGARIQVLMFVSETCAVCRAETQALVSRFASRGGLPVNADFHSVVVGAFPEDAVAWGRDLSVSWVLGTDDGDALFRSYCAELQTPCAILRNPVTGSVTKLVGEHPLDDWERATGPWIY